MLVIYPASKSISRKFLAPKVIQGRIQNGLCGHPFRNLADGAPRWAAFLVEFDLGMDGNPWKPMIFPYFFGTTIHLPTIAPGYKDFDTATSRHASYLALVMDSLGDFSRESKTPWENGAVLFPIFPPLRFVQTGRPQATEVFAIGHHCFHKDQSQPEMTIQLAVKVWARSFSGWFWYLKPTPWMLAFERPNRHWAIAAEFDVYPLLDMFASSWLRWFTLLYPHKTFIDFIATPRKTGRSKEHL